MTTPNIIEGLQILQKYRDEPDGYHCGAEHDVFYAYATDRPLELADLDRMIELGWFQENVDYLDDDETGGDFSAKHYNPSESWAAFV